MSLRFYPRRIFGSVLLLAGGAIALGLHCSHADNSAAPPSSAVAPASTLLAKRPAKAKAKTKKAAQDTKPDGTARQTADVWQGSPRGPGDAFEDPYRDVQLRIQWVMDQLKIHPGAVVADIGAGGGWFTVRAARRVGAKGLVYAEEILPRYTQYIERRAKRENLTNIRTILGTTTDPKLPANTFNSVLILNAYHEFEQPLTMLRKIHAAMKPGARLGFIERDDDELRREAREAYARTGKIKRRVDERPDNNPHTDDHRLARDVIEREAASVGFTKVLSSELGDDNYLLVVTRK